MFCKSCGTSLSEPTPDFCPKCGAKLSGDTVQSENSSAEVNYTKPKKSSKKTIIIIAAAVVALIIIIAIASSGGRDPVEDAKGLIFDSLSETETFGEIISETMDGSPKWSSKEIGDDEYLVTITGVAKELGKKITINIGVTYGEEYVYGTIDSFIINGEEYDGLYVDFLINYLFG